jgi:hypothetical protein
MLYENVFKLDETVFCLCEIDFMVHNSNRRCQIKNIEALFRDMAPAANTENTLTTETDQHVHQQLTANSAACQTGPHRRRRQCRLAHHCFSGAHAGQVPMSRACTSLVESKDIGIIGVGEGTFPSIRGTLATIGIDEARFIRECNGTFKQGIRFNDWVRAPAAPAPTTTSIPSACPASVPADRSCCPTGCKAGACR